MFPTYTFPNFININRNLSIDYSIFYVVYERKYIILSKIILNLHFSTYVPYF